MALKSLMSWDKEREEQDRIRNIVVLGVNTFGWSHQVHGLAGAGTSCLNLVLEAPSGERFGTYGGKSLAEIER